jgi:hypothetical protein
MTTDQLEAACRQAKSSGNSRIAVPVNVLQNLIRQAQELAAMPKLARDAAKALRS